METLQAWAVLLFMAVLVLVGAAHGAERREVKKRRKDAIGFEPEAFENTKSRSSARWATDKLLKKAGLFGGKGLRIGYAPESGRLMRWNGDAHACLIAPTGMGKGTDILIPNLLSGLDDYSVATVDPKGELAVTTELTASVSARCSC